MLIEHLAHLVCGFALKGDMRACTCAFGERGCRIWIDGPEHVAGRLDLQLVTVQGECEIAEYDQVLTLRGRAECGDLAGSPGSPQGLRWCVLPAQWWTRQGRVPAAYGRRTSMGTRVGKAEGQVAAEGYVFKAWAVRSVRYLSRGTLGRVRWVCCQTVPVVRGAGSCGGRRSGRRCGSECRGLGVRQRECRGCCGWRCRARVVVLVSGEVVGSRPVCRSVFKFTCWDASVPRRRDAWRVRVAAWPGSCGVLSAGTGAGVCGCRPVAFAVADPAPAYAARIPLPDPGCTAEVRKVCPWPSWAGRARFRSSHGAVPVLRRPGHAGQFSARDHALREAREKTTSTSSPSPSSPSPPSPPYVTVDAIRVLADAGEVERSPRASSSPSRWR